MAYSARAIITFLGDDGQPVDPGYGVPGGHPSQGLPIGGGHPSHGLPGGGHAIQLPVYPFDPTRPNNDLPDNDRPVVWPPRPGSKFIVKYLACVGLIGVPDQGLPEGPEPK